MKLSASIPIFAALLVLAGAADDAVRACPRGQVIAVGAVEETFGSRSASRGIRTEWCEGYDARRQAHRSGRYRVHYPGAALRLEANYFEGRLAGPVVGYHENGRFFLRGELAAGEWQGVLALHHENGAPFGQATSRRATSTAASSSGIGRRPPRRTEPGARESRRAG